MDNKSFDLVRQAFAPGTLLEQIKKMGQVGLNAPGQGRSRLALTDADRQGRDLFVSWLRELDLDVRIDAVGNIFGLLPGLDDEQPIMLGSHLDSVEQAGEYDGVYGVLSALAVIRAWRASGLTPPRTLLAAAFSNEEGARFQPDMLGSLVHAGGLDLERALDVIGIDGRRFGDELARIGYAGDMRPGSLRPAAYLELHVEQGPVLDQNKLQIGIVEGMQGISWHRLTCLGQANHGGTTPLPLRRDAGLAAFRIIGELEKHALDNPGALLTCGRLRLEPEVINVIPERAEFTLDLRHPELAGLENIERRLEEIIAAENVRGLVRVGHDSLARFAPVHFDPQLVNRLEKLALAQGYSNLRLMSGAGHDAQMLARTCPTAMIFVPSRDGVSHNPEEYTSPEDLIRGAGLLLDLVLDLARDLVGDPLRAPDLLV